MSCCRIGLKKLQGSGPVDGALIDTENAVMQTFDFLASENVVDDDEENLRYVHILFFVWFLYPC
jgi:hypothetical protein